MNGKQTKMTKRAIRRAFGEESADTIRALVQQSMAHERVFSRGFFGRLKWLLFGR